jgi:murein DD-endopeptidase MepM/ murein hydrolase activator NlpD
MQAYRVVRGDSLSALAARFGVPLDALIRVNRKQANPNLIREGELLRIPRTRAKYDDLIASLEGLLAEAEQDYRLRVKELTGIESEGDTFGGRVDLAADLATCYVGMGKAALTYSGVVRNAALRKGTFNAAQKVLVHAVSENGAGDAGKVALKATGAALADQYLKAYEQIAPPDANQFAGKLGKEAGKGTLKATAKHLIKDHIAVDKQAATEMVVNFAIQAVFTGLKKTSDIAGAVSPSNLAHVYLRVTQGEDLRMTLAQSRQAVTSSHKRIADQLTERIAALRAERLEAYPSRQSTTVPVGTVRFAKP